MAAKMQQTLCWDCARATGGCSWSNYLKPVKDWNAIEVKPTSNKPYSTYIVQTCPLFERDGYDAGTRREPREIKLGDKR